MRGRKKLQDLFTDLRVPRPWRESVPLMETGSGIAWVVGHRIADWAKVPPDSDEEVQWINFSQEQTS
jgi:tRNA(Ile)-lysidine synthase